MKWHLLNQLFVNLDSEDYNVSILEEAVSSELSLVQLLVSGLVSVKTGTSLYRGLQVSNLKEQGGLL